MLSDNGMDYSMDQNEFYLFSRKGWVLFCERHIIDIFISGQIRMPSHSLATLKYLFQYILCLYTSKPEMLFHPSLRMQQFCSLENRRVGFTSIFTCTQQNIIQARHFFPGTLSLKQISKSKSLKNIPRTILFPVSSLFTPSSQIH